MKRHPVLPEPDLTPYEVVAEEKTSMFAVFSKQYVFVTIFLLVVMVLGYGGIIYGNARLRVPVPGRKPRLQRQLRLRPDRLGRRGRRHRLSPQRPVRRPGRAQMDAARRRHRVRRRLVRRLQRAQHPGRGRLVHGA